MVKCGKLALYVDKFVFRHYLFYMIYTAHFKFRAP